MSCENHLKEIAGLKMPELSKAIVDLHYEALAELFQLLPRDFKATGIIDYANAKIEIAFHQDKISQYLILAKPHAEKLWQISKPHMEQATDDGKQKS